MWITALDERVLRGAEWELARLGISTLWDDLESQADDDEPGTTDVRAFDRLARPARLALLAQVAKGLHDEAEPCADLTALNEATIAAVFAQVRYLVEMDIEADELGIERFTADPTRRPRALVLAATCEVEPGRRGDLPDVGSDDVSAWDGLIEELLFRVLDDVDYLTAEVLRDAPASRRRLLAERLGIDEAYWTAAPPAPTGGELAAIRADLRRLCGRPDAWADTPRLGGPD